MQGIQNKQRQTEPYVVRQHAFAFVAFVVVGLTFVIFPWLVDPGGPIWMYLAFIGLGTLSVICGAVGWRAARIGLVVDRFGVWVSGYSLARKKLIPWDSISSVAIHNWDSPDGEHQDVLLSLVDTTIHPARHYSKFYEKQLERIVGPNCSEALVAVGHDEWDWDPEEFICIVRKCLERPQVRDFYGDFFGASK